MNSQRKLVNSYRPQGQPGFLGPGHIARPVLSGDFAYTDPFIFLMDDWLDKKDEDPVGGPHPHAGFETVSLLLEGEIGDDSHRMKGGDFEIMTAGSGIVHTETIDKQVKMRLLQLWLSLPKKDRWTEPRLQNISSEHAPSIKKDGVSIKLYSGSLSGITSPIQQYTPLIVADISIDASTHALLEIPADHNTFLYVLKGSMKVGADNKSLQQDEVGWLDLSDKPGQSDLLLQTDDTGVRFVLYAAKPTGDIIVSHGPFIADRADEIQRLYQDYRRGKMQHIAEVSGERRLFY